MNMVFDNIPSAIIPVMAATCRVYMAFFHNDNFCILRVSDVHTNRRTPGATGNAERQHCTEYYNLQKFLRANLLFHDYFSSGLFRFIGLKIQLVESKKTIIVPGIRRFFR
jgi:hypothetical protein